VKRWPMNQKFPIGGYLRLPVAYPRWVNGWLYGRRPAPGSPLDRQEEEAQ
jgi:hypothetical protein